MILSPRKRFDDYETKDQFFIDYTNELLEITLVEELCQIIEIIYQKILAINVFTLNYS